MIQTGFSRVAAALGDPAREAMVSALFDGRALPAGELASIAGVSPQSASAHLQKLMEARVLSARTQGRFRYYRIYDDEVALLVETLINHTVKLDQYGGYRPRVSEELRHARTCYRHLAGELGVELCRALVRLRFVVIEDSEGYVTQAGLRWCYSEGIAFDPSRRPHVRLCNDWTERLPHLSGPFSQFYFETPEQHAKCRIAPRASSAAANAAGSNLL